MALAAVLPTLRRLHTDGALTHAELCVAVRLAAAEPPRAPPPPPPPPPPPEPEPVPPPQQKEKPTGNAGPAVGDAVRAKPPGKNASYTGSVVAVRADGGLTVQFRGLDAPSELPPGHKVDPVAPPPAEAAAPPPPPAAAQPTGLAAALAAALAGAAPARGGGGAEGLLVLMRHGVRSDDGRHGDLPTDVPAALWPDSATRPHDPPLAQEDLGVVSSAANALLDAGHRPRAVLSSPYRRCLQTAGIAARAFGVEEVQLRPELQEWVMMARRCTQKVKGLPQGEPLAFLGREEAAEAVGDGVRLRWPEGWEPSNSAVEEDIGARVADAIPRLAKEFASEHAVLVTHGDLINSYLPELFDGIGAFRADEGGWAAIAPPAPGMPWPRRVPDASWMVARHRIENL